MTLNYTRSDKVFSRKSDDDDLSGGEIAGIVIGTIAGAIILGFIIFIGICICAKKRILCFKKHTQVSTKSPNTSQTIIIASNNN